MNRGDLVTITGHPHDPSPTATGFADLGAPYITYFDIEKGTTGLVVDSLPSEGRAAILLDDGRLVWFFYDSLTPV